MSSWKWCEPGDDNEPVWHTITEEEIIRTYYPWWKKQMEKVKREHLISEQNCIEDFVVVHWAERVPE